MRDDAKSGLAALAVAAMLLGQTGPAMAQAEEESESTRERAEELAREGAERLTEALEMFLQAIPQYGMPRIEENGDIVIPRLDKPEAEDNGGEEAPEEEQEPEVDETAT